MPAERLSVGNEKQQTGWESVAELADNKQAEFKEACKVGCKRMLELQSENKGSDFSQAFEGFTKICHEKSAEFIETVVERTEQLAEADDPEISILQHSKRAGISGGRWGSQGEFGTGEFLFETLGSKCTPKDIGRLETILRTIPSSDYAKYENMRIDAFRIEHKVIDDRSFIHDCAPEAHKLISAMVDYYDAKDDTELVEQKRTELANLLSELRSKHGAGYTSAHEKYMFNLDNYDEPAGEYGGDHVGLSKEQSAKIYDGDKGEVKVIDILRRLEKNMQAVPLEAPQTKIPDLNAAFEALGKVPINPETGDFRISIDDLGPALAAMNRHLIENQGQRTLFPSTITAAAYIDELSAAALRNLSKKEWQEAAFNPAFKEMVRFAWLTRSGGYSLSAFERMYSNFTRKAGQAFKEEVDDAQISEAFKIFTVQASKDVVAVAEEFAGNPNLDYLAQAVWSGNLTHEIMAISEKY